MINLLIVEDDIDLARTVIDYLAFESMHCEHASNGIAGLNFIENNSYEVIILDINMPQIDGITLCKRLRSLKIDTPVLVLTAADTLNNEAETCLTGCNDYLSKPFAMPDLIARIQKLIKQQLNSRFR